MVGESRARALVLLSGGLDSAANLALATNDPKWHSVSTLTIDYGQRARHAEIRSAKALAEHFSVSWECLDLSWLGALGGSALTDSATELPHPESQTLDHPVSSAASAKAVWVPNRNGVLIHCAAAVAERRGISHVLVGFNREEAATFPDNTKDYLERVTRALELSTANHVRLESYTLDWDKTQIVAALDQLPTPFAWELIWSCYSDVEQPCGKCESCLRLARARAAR